MGDASATDHFDDGNADGVLDIAYHHLRRGYFGPDSRGPSDVSGLLIR